MKRIIGLFSLVLIGFGSLSAYNYQTVYSHRTAYFKTDHNSLTTIKIDSAKLLSDSILYPIKNLQLVDNNCLDPKGSSLLGGKVLINKDWNYFYNEDYDTIKIKTSAKLKERWTIFKRSDITIDATLIKWDIATVLGVIDSVKTFQLNVIEITASSVPHPLQGKTILLSKRFGLVSTPSLLYFPKSKYLYTGLSFNISSTYALAGITHPNLGTQNLTWFDAYDFQEGDIFHYTYGSNYLMYGGDCVDEKTIKKILDRINYSDSIIYKIDLEISSRIRHQGELDFTQSYSHYQTSEKIYRNPFFDIEPGIVNYNNEKTRITLNTQLGDSKSNFPDYITYLNNGCWGNFIYMDGSNSCIISKGLGLNNSSSSTWDNMGGSEFDLVYYKKGSTTWGVPLVISGVNLPKAESNITVLPNPAIDKISINNLTEPCTLELLDLKGSVMLRTTVTTSENTFNVSHYDKGLYLYRISANGALLKAGKIVKQ